MLPFESQDAGVMTAALQRIDSKTYHFEGEGSYNGSNVRIEADASAVHAQMIVSSDTDVFIPLDNDSWYDLVMRDTQGVALRTAECRAINSRTIHATLEGTGFLPDGLSVYILVASEGEWDEASAIAAAMPIQLTMEK